MTRRVPAVLALLAVAGAPVLAGCGSDEQDTATESIGTATFRAPATTAPEPSPPTVTSGGSRGPTATSTGKREPTPTSTTAPSGPSASLTPPDRAPTPTTPAETTVERPGKPVYCPGTGGGKSPTAKERFDARDLLSLSVAEATRIARAKDCVVRVVRRDGVDLVRTMDYSNARINVTVTKGRIVRLGGIG